ncbi:hypothetical protein V5P93_003718 [Actinokineospora auranticolor]|nr:hypothetical protein [Actinokineospora auranticolor]
MIVNVLSVLLGVSGVVWGIWMWVATEQRWWECLLVIFVGWWTTTVPAVLRAGREAPPSVGGDPGHDHL